MKIPWLILIALVISVTAMSRPAHADTGGGSFQSSSTSSTSSTSSSNSGRGYRSSDSSQGYSSGGSEQSSGGTAGAAAVGLIVVMGLLAVGAGAGSTASAAPDSHYGQRESIADIMEIRIALSADVRAFVQSELMRIGNSCDTKTAHGRSLMFREVTLLLRRLRSSWVYGGATNFHPSGMSAAQQTFHKRAADARCKFTQEVIRNADGMINQQTVQLATASHEEGPGLVLVVIVAAARTDFFTVNQIGDGESLRQALDAASNRSAEDLVAIEIIWQPALTNDRLSSVELEAKYPSPALIKLANSKVGRTVCSFCSGPYPLELLTCPHCGARSQGT